MTPPKTVPMPPVPDDDDLPRALVPPAWPRPIGYANGMTAKGRVVVTAGLVGWDVMGNFPDSFAGQARQLFINMLAVRTDLGGDPTFPSDAAKPQPALSIPFCSRYRLASQGKNRSAG